jgi:predicted enzyme involved in methoxymalonyl-ACP biosynthesis
MDGAVCEIDAFLLSCRVIGRTVETAFLAALAAHAGQCGARKLGGWFIPTKKNAPSADFYSQHGFIRTGDKAGASYWELELKDHPIAAPPWIEVKDSKHE